MDKICFVCGGDLKHWNQGIYECRDCGNMVDEDIFEDDGEE